MALLSFSLFVCTLFLVIFVSHEMYPNQCITDFITKTSLIPCFIVVVVFFFNHIFSWYVQGAVIFRAKDIVLLCDLLSCSLVV